jgi:hypothetical protein
MQQFFNQIFSEILFICKPTFSWEAAATLVKKIQQILEPNLGAAL